MFRRQMRDSVLDETSFGIRRGVAPGCNAWLAVRPRAAYILRLDIRVEQRQAVHLQESIDQRRGAGGRPASRCRARHSAVAARLRSLTRYRRVFVLRIKPHGGWPTGGAREGYCFNGDDAAGNSRRFSCS